MLYVCILYVDIDITRSMLCILCKQFILCKGSLLVNSAVFQSPIKGRQQVSTTVTTFTPSVKYRGV